MLARSHCISLILIVIASPVAAAGTPLPEFDATYTIRYGVLSGTLNLRLNQDDSGLQYETSLQPRGIASWFRRGMIIEHTNLAVAEGSILPLDYRSTDTIADPVRNTRYVFGEERVTGEYKSRKIDEPMRAAGQNRASLHVAVMLALHSGRDIAEIPVFDRGRWKTYFFEVIPGRTVRTKLGEYTATEVRYSSPGKDKDWSLYLAPELSYLPVMLVYREDGRIKSKAQITGYRVSPREAAESRPAEPVAALSVVGGPRAGYPEEYPVAPVPAVSRSGFPAVSPVRHCWSSCSRAYRSTSGGASTPA